jgi:hypothetical protein
MAVGVQKSGGLMMSDGEAHVRATESPKSYEEWGLCIALVALLVWALFVGLGSVNWSTVSHVFNVIVAAF